ncbi:MAG: hypothetical protein HKN23_08520 [Verrucomicrobiales bacterium]|nr:hypothetical protein [Verrucomicrobiales bacterium]
MTNELKHAFGDKNNSEFVISPEGKIVVSRTWSDPEQLREELAGFVGESETVTKPSKNGQQPKRTEYTRGVVPRVKRPSGASVLKIEPVIVAEGDEEETVPPVEPFYAKLRAEATRAVMDGDEGELYLGFHLDPIYEVHWNNLAAPLKFSISAPDGVELEVTEGEAAKVEEKADLDPREFLVGIKGAGDEPLRLRVDYFACDNGDKWCKAIRQEYLIHFQTDRDAGRVQGGGGSRDRSKMQRPPGGGNTKGRMPNPDVIFTRFDADKDGKITKEEATGPMERRFPMMDTDKDGVVTREELKSRFERMRGGGRSPAK